MPPPVFTGRVTDAAVLVLDTPHDYTRHKATLRNKRIEVTLRRLREKRSLDQNAYLHGVVVPLMIDYTGDDVAGTKLSLMGEMWGWKKDKLTGRELPIKPHTSDLTVEEFSALIEWVGPWALTKHGVFIPLPGEAEL